MGFTEACKCKLARIPHLQGGACHLARGGPREGARSRFRTKELCRDLCRNPSIPARIVRVCGLSLGNTREEGNHERTRMNAGAESYLRSFSVARCFLQRRTVTAEAAGSVPSSPPFFSVVWKEWRPKSQPTVQPTLLNPRGEAHCVQELALGK